MRHASLRRPERWSRLAAHADRPPDKTLQFIGEMDMSGRDMSSIDMSGMDMSAMDMRSMDMGTTETGSKDMTDLDMSSMDIGRRHGNEAHDMHGHGMHQMSSPPDPTGMHHQDMAGEGAHSIPPPEADDHIEWEDTMPEMNVMSNLSNMVWRVVDTATARPTTRSPGRCTSVTGSRSAWITPPAQTTRCITRSTSTVQVVSSSSTAAAHQN